MAKIYGTCGVLSGDKRYTSSMRLTNARCASSSDFELEIDAKSVVNAGRLSRLEVINLSMKILGGIAPTAVF